MATCWPHAEIGVRRHTLPSRQCYLSHGDEWSLISKGKPNGFANAHDIGFLRLLSFSFGWMGTTGHPYPGFQGSPTRRHVSARCAASALILSEEWFFVNVSTKTPQLCDCRLFRRKDRYWIRRCEVTKYSLADGEKTQLSESLSKLTPKTTDEEVRGIAAKLKVEVSRFTIAPKSLSKSLGELKAIRISPVPPDRVSVDEYSEYEFWYDRGQESAHYALTGPPGKGPQDELTRWMIRFQAHLSDLLKAPSAPMP